MRARLERATVESLIERGHAGTTALEVCRRAGVTRGAFHHHFPSLSALYAAALRSLYADLTAGVPPAEPGGDVRGELKRLARRISHFTRQPGFKAVIEIWLAARNDPELRLEVAPEIERLSLLFSPTDNPKLARRIGRSRRASAFYYLVLEATIGMALGRATSVADRPVAHEEAVIELLAEIADGV
jgi:AcrR family transcriptional regulator